MSDSKGLPAFALLELQKVPYKIIHLSRLPRSADDISEIYGCALACVVKTLLFTGDKTVIVCIPGDKVVDKNALKLVTQAKKLELASEDEVYKFTGMQIGGVSPFFDSQHEVIKVLDEACLNYETINIGAGDPYVGLEMSSEDLKKIWPGNFAKISKDNVRKGCK